MKRIAFFQDNLNVGGIQKSLMNLLGNIDYGKYQVDLYLFDENKFWNNNLPKEVNIKYLPPISRIYSFLPFEKAKKSVHLDFSGCEEYDAAIDFNSYQDCCAIGAISVPAKKRVMWIHNDVEIKLANEWKYRVLWSFFKGKFKYFDQFVGVSGGLIEPFKKMSGMTDKKYSVIPNFIDADEIRRKMQDNPDDISVDDSCTNFVALGRLCHQKGYDIMLDTFKKAFSARPDLRLYIIGDGPDRAMLENKIDSLGLENKVFLLGNKENPYCYMSKMDAFISTSRYEGQGMNIMEAMVIGLPLYCSDNLEKYVDGLHGYSNVAEAMVKAGKCDKHPDDLIAYNSSILASFDELTNI